MTENHPGGRGAGAYSAQQIIPQEPGKKVYQSQLNCGDGKIFLVRVIVADEISPPVVVTVYRTKKITKYWRLP